MLRILHSADWQLGSWPKQLPERGPEAQEERFRAAERVVELAHDRQVDLVLLAGDTFDSPDLDESLFRRGVRLLESFAPVPVRILPGNHDPLVPGGVWQRRAFRRLGDHVRLLDAREESEPVPGLALYPCPLTQKRSPRDPTEWLPARDEGDRRTRVAVAHGALASLGVAETFPIDVDRIRDLGFDWIALGDWHGRKLFEGGGYPGTIEASGFGEQDPGYALIVELDGPDRAPEIESVPVGRLRWRQIRARIRDQTDLEQLRVEVAEARGEGDPGDLVLRIVARVEGAWSDVESALADLREETESSVFALDFSSQWAATDPAALPAGLLSDVDALLGAVAEGDEEAVARLSGALSEESGSEPMDARNGLEVEAIALEARRLLHRLARRAS